MPSIPTCKNLVIIDESRCIGCALCRMACPFDAIAGAPGYLYHIIEPYCTGCGLCLPPCPVDCISQYSNPHFTRVTHAERVEFARETRARAEKIRRLDLQKTTQQQREYDLLKKQVAQQATTTIDRLRKKLLQTRKP